MMEISWLAAAVNIVAKLFMAEGMNWS